MHSNLKTIKILVPLAILIVAAGCQKEEKVKDVAAKAGASVLTRAEALYYTDSSKNRVFREEFIRSWIADELLYHEARENGITDSREYQRLTEQSNKRLASALFLRKYLKETGINIDENELKSFFVKNKDDFRIGSDAVVYNKAVFDSLEEAVEFKNTVNRIPWEEAAVSFSQNLSSHSDEVYENLYEVAPARLQRIIGELLPGETSIVLETEQNNFIIVQLTNRFSKNDIPDFKYLREEVKDRYIAAKTSEIYNNLIERLYKKYNPEIFED